MSIYPVKISEWYYDPKNAFFTEREMLEEMLPSLKCEVCGKKITKRGYVMHSITFGGPGEALCSKKCILKW